MDNVPTTSNNDIQRKSFKFGNPNRDGVLFIGCCLSVVIACCLSRTLARDAVKNFFVVGMRNKRSSIVDPTTNLQKTVINGVKKGRP